MKDRIALAAAGFAALLHLAVANRYDLFRDELYFIVCGQHPAFGYADQPPLVPLLAAAGYAFGGQTWVVRLPDVIAAAALAYLCVAFARLLGARDVAACLAGFAAAVAPMFAGITGTLNTTTFEPLAWTAVAYGIARLALLDDRRAPYWAGAIAGVALEAKYALPLWLVALAIGLACTPERRIFARRELWLGFALAAVIAAPSLVWQAAHGWPFLELVHNARMKDVDTPPLAFALNQVLVFSPLLAPVWIFGILAPFALRPLRSVRFLAIAYAITAVATVAGHGKDYYLAAAVPPLFVMGAVGLQIAIASPTIRAVYSAIALVLTLPILPIALPILPPDRLVPYEVALHLVPQQQERGDAGDAFPSLFSDMLGWHDFVREVGTAYRSLTPEERATTAVLVDNYGEAAAIDLYGHAYDFPRALSGQNQYYLFGPTPDATSTNLLRVQYDVDALRPYCDSVRILGTTHSPYARSFENGMTIAFCTRLHPALSKVWPSLKRFI